MIDVTEPFTGFPLPEGYALVCPHCEKYKMRETENPNIFQCASPLSICGKITSSVEVELYKAQRIVKE